MSKKQALGFIDGFIIIYLGEETSVDNEYFKASHARYCRIWGWYTPSNEPVLNDLPKGIDAVKLYENEVFNEDGTIKSDLDIETAIDNKMYLPTNSTFQGEIGERLELTIEVSRNIPLGQSYGKPQILHVFVDSDENEYVWITAARNWAPGTVKKIRGTVKEHRIYRNSKMTYLSRCMEVK